MTEGVFKQGDFVYHSDEQGWFLLYKILGNEQPYLARCYWPTPEEPTLLNLLTFDVRTACEETEIPLTALVLTNEAISSEDDLEVQNFLRIKTGLDTRKKQWKLLLSQAEEWVHQQRYEEAVVCCTECASFVKYEARVFQLRGHAYLQLERYSEAIADLEHALSIQPGQAETLFDCVFALIKKGKRSEAREKMEMLVAVKMDEEKIHLLEAMLRD